MTNEEAVEILIQIRKQSCVSECDYTCKLYESVKFCREEKALDLAIKALGQTNKVEESNFSLEQYKADLQGAYDCGYARALERQPRMGEWIEVEVCNCYATLKCSVCDRVIEPTFTYGEYSYDDIKEWYPYCHCGCRMNGGGEDAEELTKQNQAPCIQGRTE